MAATNVCPGDELVCRLRPPRFAQDADLMAQTRTDRRNAAMSPQRSNVATMPPAAKAVGARSVGVENGVAATVLTQEQIAAVNRPGAMKSTVNLNHVAG